MRRKVTYSAFSLLGAAAPSVTTVRHYWPGAHHSSCIVDVAGGNLGSAEPYRPADEPSFCPTQAPQVNQESNPHTVYLADYAVPPFVIPEITMDIDLRTEELAVVRTLLRVERNQGAEHPEEPLRLDLDELEVESVSLDGQLLERGRYALDSSSLSLSDVPSTFTLETVSRINPKANTKLMGIYTSSAGFFSLCEAEGFRRITPFPDRPDVMARYQVTLHADKETCPILLANGNLTDQGDEADGRHFATFVDPYPKPSYLFAVVAGKLEYLTDRFKTCSGREVQLQFFVEPGKLKQAAFALESLKYSMRWDEEVYGREMDLDQYNLVAVGDFNAGAMENKGLNIFNTKLVLASSDVSTDWDFRFVDRTVAHEYFHNWTGNRVTCRDWFELSLKEGLTVFREQQYAADRYSRGVERIQTVRNLRTFQFPEDAGPMAHTIRPLSYEEISNFYTATVYSKGAEVVGMIHTLLGQEGFRKGMDLYFERHDGQAVTTMDFVQAMQDANGYDFGQFKRWYEQAGTPRLEVSDHYDSEEQVYELRVSQSCPATPGQEEKLPFHIPFAVGLLDEQGKDIPLRLQGEDAAQGTTRKLSLHEPLEVFRFLDVKERPVPSLLRNFSAPVNLDYKYKDAALLHLLSFDSDCFNRWQAGQTLLLEFMLKGVEQAHHGERPSFPAELLDAFARLLADAHDDPAFVAEAFVLPGETYIAGQVEVIDPDAIHKTRQSLRQELASALNSHMRSAYDTFTVPGEYRPDAESAGRRSLRNLCLAYLMELNDEGIRALCVKQFQEADNMTDSFSALTSLANCDCPERQTALDAFYDKWKEEPLVVDKWLGVQAASRLPGTLDAVKALTNHPAFDLKNPNKVYSLIGSFAGNQFQFHAADGSGYDFLVEQISQLDSINPQVTARMARHFDAWKKFDDKRQSLMHAALRCVAALPGLSKETSEVVNKALL